MASLQEAPTTAEKQKKSIGRRLSSWARKSFKGKVRFVELNVRHFPYSFLVIMFENPINLDVLYLKKIYK